MDKNILKGQVSQLSGKIKETWGKLTDDDISVISGKKDQLVGKIQEKYGIAKEEALKQVIKFEEDMHDAVNAALSKKMK